MTRTEEHREFGVRFHKSRCPFEIRPCPIEQDVVPHTRSPRPTRNPSQWSLQLHNNGDRQPGPVSLRQQIAGDDRLVSLRRSVVSHKQVTVGNAAQRSGAHGSGQRLDSVDHCDSGMDLGVERARIAGVRKVLAAVAVVAIAALAAAAAAGGDRSAGRVSVPARLSASVPAGWHVLRGWLSDVTDPAPRLAVASFPARLSRHTCECGFPNVVGFPRDGGFIFVWEYLHPTRWQLARAPSRPVRFRLAAGGGLRQTCDGSSDTFGFKDAGRVFQVEVYVGPHVELALREQVAAMLDSLRAAPDA